MSTDTIIAACAARTPFRCCRQAVSADQVRVTVSPQLFAQYIDMVEEVREANPTYCHRRICGAFLPVRLATGPDVSACDHCGRGTCRHCKGASHAGRECVADVATQQARTLAARNGWKACPRCRNMVERSSGCMHMMCRCGAGFCYRCGRLTSHCGGTCRG